VNAFYSKRTHRPGRLLRARLVLEQLETRTLPSAYTPAQIVNAYGFNQIAFNSGAVKGDGAGQTIAIVDAYYDATIKNDLSTFSRQYGLPQLDGIGNDGAFKQVDLSHGTPSPAGDDWTLETALDVEWAHAVAPRANIVLVEAASDAQNAAGKPVALLNAVQTAATYSLNGVPVGTVSMSWGINEVAGETAWDSYINVPGVTFVAASGDSGAGTIWPAVSPYVVSVGGTSLNLSRTNTISSETGWGTGDWSFLLGGSGGGFSQYEPLPSYQSGITTGSGGFTYTQFQARLNPDVAYNADPNTGYHVYDGVDGGWSVVGGTSAGAPQWAALFAIADEGRKLAGETNLGSTQTLNALYSNPGDFHDITKGSTGTYEVLDNSGNVTGYIPVTALRGYDLVTGLGSPVANAIVPALVGATSAASPLAASHGSGTSSGHHGSGGNGGANGLTASPTGLTFALNGTSSVQNYLISAGVFAAQAVPAPVTGSLAIAPSGIRELPPVSFAAGRFSSLVEREAGAEPGAAPALPREPATVPERAPAPRPEGGNTMAPAPNLEPRSLRVGPAVENVDSPVALLASSATAAPISVAGAAALLSMGYGFLGAWHETPMLTAYPIVKVRKNKNR